MTPLQERRTTTSGNSHTELNTALNTGAARLKAGSAASSLLHLCAYWYPWSREPRYRLDTILHVLKEALSPCSDLGLTFCHTLKLCTGGVGRAWAWLVASLCLSTSESSHTKKWHWSTGALEPVTTSLQKHCMTSTGQAGQPGLLAERPDRNDTNHCSWQSYKSWYFHIKAQLQSGCCAVGCCREAFPKQCVLGQSPGPHMLAGARYVAALSRLDLHAQPLKKPKPSPTGAS